MMCVVKDRETTSETAVPVTVTIDTKPGSAIEGSGELTGSLMVAAVTA